MNMLKALFAGTGSLSKFMFRRDRIRLVLWIFGISLFVIVCAPYYADMYPTAAERLVIAQTMENPAMIALVGPVYGADDYTSGAMFSNYMLLFTGIVTAVMNIFLITRHTRHDEELGRMEVVRSMPVGRLGNTAAAMLVALTANVLTTLLIGFGITACQIEGMDLAGSMTFAISLGCVGLFFAAATSVFCQLTSNNRTATGLSFMFLMLTYLLRAVGDNGSGVLSCFSPFGYMHMTESYVRNLLWPLFVLIAVAVIISVFAFYLGKIRDLGQGLIPARRGKGTASALLSNTFGLSFRLLRGSVLTWCAVIFVLSALFGALFGELESFVENSDLLKAMFSHVDYSITDEFITMLTAIMALVSTIPVLSMLLKIRAEESAGHSEHILSRSVARTSQLAGYSVFAFVSGAVFMLIASLGMGIVGTSTLETAPGLGVFIKAGLSYLPAVWIMLGIAILLTGLLPKLTVIVYAYLGYSFFSVWFGSMMELPEWTGKLTPYGHIPQIPLEEMNLPILLALTGIAVVVTIAGFYGYRRRDVVFH
jgi:ABC-2 type transport system permease protein